MPACCAAAQSVNGVSPRPYGHVVAQRPWRDEALRQCRHLAVQARRRGVHDQVVSRPLDRAELAARDRAGVVELGAQRLRARRGPVRDRQLAHALFQQGAQHAARRAAGTEHQHALVLQAEFEVALQVVDQPGTVGVVAEQRAVRAQRQRVHGARAPGPGRQLARHRHGGLLVRNRDVQAADPLREQLRDPAFELLRRDVEHPVNKILARLLRKQPVDERRPAVRNRVAYHAVVIGSGAAGPQRHASHAAARFAK